MSRLTPLSVLTESAEYAAPVACPSRVSPSNPGDRARDQVGWGHAAPTVDPSALPLTRVGAAADLPLPTDDWPGTLPAVRQVLADGLDLGPLTVLVGENGAG
jgi:hypothetical protein